MSMMMMVRSFCVCGLAWCLLSSMSQHYHHASVDAFSVQSISHNKQQRPTVSSFLGTNSARIFRPSTSTSTTLSMHMGHSHSHHTHLHADDDHAHAQQKQLPTAQKNRLFTKAKTIRFVAMFLFCAIITLGPSVVWRQTGSIRRADIAAFCLTFATFAAFNEIRRGVKNWLFKLQRLRQGFLKHQPKTKLSLRKYLLENENAADRVTLLGVAINIVLSTSKFIVGITSHSSALVADAGHSLSDLFSDFVTLYSVQIARLPPDDDHPYGHGKFEAIGSLFLALILLATGVSVGANAYRELAQIIAIQIQNNSAATATATATMNIMAVKIPKAPALFMAGLSIVSKEWLYRITHKVGESLNSQVVIANAWHHRSDAYSSILALFSIALAMTVPGLVAADAAAGLLVAGMICMTGADIMGESINQLSDTSNQELVNRVRAIARDHDDVLQVNRIRTRQVGSMAVVDVSVTTPEALSSSAIRTVEQRIRQRILEQEPHFVAEAEVRGTNYNPRLVVGQQQQQKKNVVENETLIGVELQSRDGSGVDGSSSGTDIIDGPLSNAAGSATDPNQQVHSPLDCPLLVSMSIHGAADECPSASQVESTARELTMSSSFYPDTITAVQGVTVHYDDPIHAIVDVDIRVASQRQQQQESSGLDGATAMSVTSAQEVANLLRQRLEASPSIHKANIYLDLNIQQDDDVDDKNGNGSIANNNGEIYSPPPPPAAVMSQSTAPQSTAPASAAVTAEATRDSIHSKD